ncbi:MAG TPA: type II toxin-antitoxin system VapC family toxin [Lacipirellulaceae bacterium]|nr:type II toxin-antitoxin system VapC family toxin [Lacipirellulaceae bacterium]
MRVLLDTHAFLWFVKGDDRLTNLARSVIEDSDNAVFVSVASIWEMSIKIAIRKPHLTDPFDEFLSREIAAFQVLDITAPHALRTARLPFHHRDPFDRLLAAVCLEEGLPIVSIDNLFDTYNLGRIWEQTYS